jgi:hypothetical protein
VVDEREGRRRRRRRKVRRSFSCTTGARERNLVRRYKGVKVVRLAGRVEKEKTRQLHHPVSSTWDASPPSSELEDEPHTVLFLAIRTQISVHQNYLGYAYSP